MTVTQHYITSYAGVIQASDDAIPVHAAKDEFDNLQLYMQVGNSGGYYDFRYQIINAGTALAAPQTGRKWKYVSSFLDGQMWHFYVEVDD